MIPRDKNAKLESATLIRHGTYSEQGVREVESLKRMVFSERTASFSLKDKIRLINYMVLTESYVDPEAGLCYTDEWVQFVRRLGGLDPPNDALVDAITGAVHSSEYGPVVGYKYATMGSPRPPSMDRYFPISSEDSWIDVGAGFGTRALEVAKIKGGRTCLLDPNAVNIRMAYHRLIEEGLEGNPSIRILLDTVQNAVGYLGHCFRAAYLGNTLILETDETAREIVQAAVGLVRINLGRIAIVGLSEKGVVFPPLSQIETDAKVEEEFVKDESGFDVRLIRTGGPLRRIPSRTFNLDSQTAEKKREFLHVLVESNIFFGKCWFDKLERLRRERDNEMTVEHFLKSIKKDTFLTIQIADDYLQPDYISICAVLQIPREPTRFMWYTCPLNDFNRHKVREITEMVFSINCDTI